MPLATLKLWKAFYIDAHDRALAESRRDPKHVTRIHRELTRVRRTIRARERRAGGR